MGSVRRHTKERTAKYSNAVLEAGDKIAALDKSEHDTIVARNEELTSSLTRGFSYMTLIRTGIV